MLRTLPTDGAWYAVPGLLEANESTVLANAEVVGGINHTDVVTRYDDNGPTLLVRVKPDSNDGPH